MGAYKYWNPATQKYEIIKSKSIVKEDGSLEYTPDDIKAIDNKVGILNGAGEAKEKADKADNIRGHIYMMDKITEVEDELVSHKVDYIHHAGYGTANGVNAKLIVLNPAPTSYEEGMTVAFKNATENTDKVTINVNGLGIKFILKSNGNHLTSGDLKASSIYTIRFNGTNFILQGEGGEYGTAQASDVLRPKTIGTENGIIIGTMLDRGTVNQTLTTQGGSYTISSGKHSGSGKVTVNINNLVASNIKDKVSVGGVVGTLKERETSFWSKWEKVNLLFDDRKVISIVDNGSIIVLALDWGHLYTSENGVNWTKRVTGLENTTRTFLDLAYGNGMWVALAKGGNVLTSPDGINWTKQEQSNTFNSLVYAEGKWLAGSSSDIPMFTSTDGINWSPISVDGISASVTNIEYGGGKWVVTQSDSKYLKYSTNGTTWANVNGEKDYDQPEALKFIDDTWVLICRDGIVTSEDGVTWELVKGVERTHLYRAGVEIGGEGLMAFHNSSIYVSENYKDWWLFNTTDNMVESTVVTISYIRDRWYLGTDDGLFVLK